jgi:FkbM family methyltransferase
MEEYLNKITIPDYINRIKIDVGLSYAAPQSQHWLENNNDLFVFGFEPNPDCINGIKSSKKYECPGHIKDQNISRLGIIPVALSNVDTPTTMKFYILQNDCGTSSLYEPANNKLGPVKECIEVPVYSLRDFFVIFPWDRFPYIEYLKVDAQGADLNILKGAGDYLRERVVYVTTEGDGIEYYRGCSENNEENICKYMESQGFIRVNNLQTKDPTFVNKKFVNIASTIFIKQT